MATITYNGESKIIKALVQAINEGGGGGVDQHFIIVQSLPTEDIDTTAIYLVPKAEAEERNLYDEYIFVNNSWEKIGDTAIDLKDYLKKDSVEAGDNISIIETQTGIKISAEVGEDIGLFLHNNEISMEV